MFCLSVCLINRLFWRFPKILYTSTLSRKANKNHKSILRVEFCLGKIGILSESYKRKNEQLKFQIHLVEEVFHQRRENIKMNSHIRIRRNCTTKYCDRTNQILNYSTAYTNPVCDMVVYIA